jgi:alpha-glucosidase
MVDAEASILPDPPFDRAGRDGYRTPMQWDGSPNAGFTAGAPWLPIADAATRNVEAQRADPGSVLSLYRRLITARHGSRALAVGTHRSLFGVAPDVLAWLREADDERVLVLLNLGDAPATCDLPLGRIGVTRGEVLVATSDRSGTVELPRLELGPLEGIALRLD